MSIMYLFNKFITTIRLTILINHSFAFLFSFFAIPIHQAQSFFSDTGILSGTLSIEILQLMDILLSILGIHSQRLKFEFCVFCTSKD